MMATDAAAFLTEHLVVNHCTTLSTMLSDEQICGLMSSTQAQLALLRALRPSLASTADLRAASARAATDGFWDTSTQRFCPLPFRSEHYVQATLSVVYADVSNTTHLQLAQATELLATWFPHAQELRFIIRQLSRALAPAHGDTQKAIEVHVDSLDHPEGNRGKSTFLTRIVQAIFGARLCTLSPGDCLTCGQSSAYTKRMSRAAHPLALEAFDELAAGRCATKQLDTSALKHMSGGTQSCSHLLYVACNPSNLPDLAALATDDPALYNRLVMLPARAVFTQCVPGLADTIGRLLPAICRLLLEDHGTYLREGVLSPCESMSNHKLLLTRSTHIPRGLNRSHVEVTKDWLICRVVLVPGQTLPRETLAAVFLSQHVSQLTAIHRKVSKEFSLMSVQALVSQLIDAGMARRVPGE